jgi:hypothetical protein
VTASANARAVAALLKIMNSKNTLLRRKIEACEALLSYEAPTEVVERAKSFRTAVFEDSERISVDDRLMALKLMRRASAPKVTQQSVRSADTDRDRELRRTFEVAARRMKLYKAGLWPAATLDWCDDLLSDSYVPPTDRSLDDVFNG